MFLNHLSPGWELGSNHFAVFAFKSSLVVEIYSKKLPKNWLKNNRMESRLFFVVHRAQVNGL